MPLESPMQDLPAAGFIQAQLPPRALPERVADATSSIDAVSALGRPETLAVVWRTDRPLDAGDLSVIAGYFENRSIKFEFRSTSPTALDQLQSRLAQTISSTGFSALHPELTSRWIQDLVGIASVIRDRNPDRELRCLLETNFYRGNDFHSDGCDTAVVAYAGSGTIISGTYEEAEASFTRRTRDMYLIHQRDDQHQLGANEAVFIKPGSSHRPPDNSGFRLAFAVSHAM